MQIITAFDNFDRFKDSDSTFLELPLLKRIIKKIC